MPAEKEEKLELSEDSKIFLFFINELHAVRQDNAAAKLEWDVEYLYSLAEELSYKGFIDIELGSENPMFTLAEEGRKFVDKIHREVQLPDEDGASEESEKPKPSLNKLVKKILGGVKNAVKLFAEKIREEFHKLLFLLSIGFSLYLLLMFLQDPNKEIFSFLFGTFIISLILILYARYKSELERRAFIGFAEWFIVFLKRHRGPLLVTSVGISLVYVLGMVTLGGVDSTAYFIIAAVLLSTPVAIYMPHSDVHSIFRFYAGMVLLVYSMLLLVGVSSITSELFKQPFALMDFAFGAMFLFIAYTLRDYFGIGVEPIYEVLNELKSDKKKKKPF